MLTYAQLTTPFTQTEAEAEVIQRLAELGFASKGWQSGSMQLTLGVKLPAWIISQFSKLIAAIAKGMSNETAESDFLTRYSRSTYSNERLGSVAAQYTIRHTVASGEGPHAGIQVGDLIATNGSYTYRNITTADLTSAAPVDLIYEAEVPGQDANTEDNSITELVTPLAGVTITNPLGSLVQAGADEESDAVLRLRNTDRWSQLSIEMPADGYRGVCLGVAGVGRCEVDDTNPRGPYTIDVYVAGPNSAAGELVRAAAETALFARRSITADVQVLEPEEQSIPVAGTVYVSAAYKLSAPAAIATAIDAYVNTLPIGGEQLTASTKGVTLDGIIAAIRAVAGVRNVNLTSPPDDVTMSEFKIAVANVSALSVSAL